MLKPKFSGHHKFVPLLLVLIVLGSLVEVCPAAADPDLNPTANMVTIPAGSLVIPMDNAKQDVGATFNLYSYGLANDLLWANIPVMWAIKAGKAKQGVDFTASAKRIAPTTIAAATLSFRGGPFIVHRDYKSFALPRIAAFGNNVAVYELTQDVSVDIRYTLVHKPKVACLNDGGNADIHEGVLDEAGFVANTHYVRINATSLTTLHASSCITMASEPHWGDSGAAVDSAARAVRGFVESGGNFLAQCAGVETYENDALYGRFQSTLGILEASVNTSFSWPNADLAYSQIDSILDTGGGSLHDYKLAGGSAWRANVRFHAQNVAPNTDRLAAASTKLTAGTGSQVFYLGSHSYGTNNIGEINGRRMYLNAVLSPAGRPAGCLLNLTERTIAGRVLGDPNGDGSLADATVKSGVRVRLYADVNNNGVVNSGDTYVAEATTDAGGNYGFLVSEGLTGTKYLVAVDSRTITPSAAYNAGYGAGDVWAEETYGDDPTTAALDLAPRFGGRQPSVSDRVSATSTSPDSSVYEHLGRVDVSGGDVSGVEFGFSYNVVTTVRGGDATDDDAGANRTVQGSLRQFVQNANALAGANAMRFTPAEAANGSSGGNTWWRIDVSQALPAVVDSVTTLDGRAYGKADGVTVLNSNAAAQGTAETVGADSLYATPTLDPELELRGSGVATGLDLRAASVTVRRLAVLGFAQNGLATRIAATGFLVENNVVGAAASSFTDPGAALRLGTSGILVDRTVGGIVRNNLIGFSAGPGLLGTGGARTITVEGNEFRANDMTPSGEAALLITSDGNGSARQFTVLGNLFVDNRSAGLAAGSGSNTVTVTHNTVRDCGIGVGTASAAGVILGGNGSVVNLNRLHTNYGAGLVIPSGAAGDRVSQNEIFNNGTRLNLASAGPTLQVGIDLLGVAGDPNTPPFVTPNDAGDGDAGGNGLFNFAVLDSAFILGPDLYLIGFARPGSVIEFFIADGDASGFGEGKTYITTLTEGSGADLDASTASYGPGPVNGKSQGQDTTNRFRFVLPVSGVSGVTTGTVLTATARDASDNTSEFGGTVTVRHRFLLVKRVFFVDGTPIADGASLPAGAKVKFLLYVNNRGSGQNDISVQDVLDPGLTYVAGSIKTTAALVRCAGNDCTGAEEAAIFTGVNALAAASDAVDGDAVSYLGLTRTIHAGDSMAANAQLDFGAAKVWALLFTAKLE